MLHNPKKKIVSINEDIPIRLAGVIPESIVDGPELRFVVFVQGCPHNCKNCHNPETPDFDGGSLTTTGKIWQKISANPLLKGVTFSGGEPFVWAHELAVVGEAAHKAGLSVLTYSGYTWEQLLEKSHTEPGVKELLTVADYLIDGPYIDSQRDLNLLFRGSRNQRILDITCFPNSEKVTVLEKI